MALARSHARPAPARASLLRRALDLLALRRARRRLTDLDAHMLQDIGLSAEQARHEADLPFWDAPAHWRR